MSENKGEVEKAVKVCLNAMNVTPEDYLRIRDVARREIIAHKDALGFALEQAQKTPFPESVRKAVPGDIVMDAIIWYKNGGEGPFWKIVEEPTHYGDAWKAYVADDGCRYGLDGAYVEVRE